MPVRGATVYRPRLVPRFSAGSGVSATGPGPNRPVGPSWVLRFAEYGGDVQPVNGSSVANTYGTAAYFGNTDLVVTSDGTAPASPPNYLRVTYPGPGTAQYPGATGMPGGSYDNPFAIFGDSSQGPTYTELYGRIRMRVDSAWTDNGNAGTKCFFYEAAQSGNNHYINLTDSGTFDFAVNLQSTFGYATPSGPNHSSGTISKGVWHDIEYLLIANTPGSYNGVAKVWIDGVLALNVTDMGYFDTGQTGKFTGSHYVNSTYGGGTNAVPATQGWDIDHWGLWGAP